ncbi:unnamed protein product, partial [Allacma fusca]
MRLETAKHATSQLGTRFPMRK